MKRQIIRLTEGDLHQIIENSVKKCLNELDWKTYQNAARKSRVRAQDINRSNAQRNFDTKRGEIFQNAANDKFKKTYNITNDDENKESFGNYSDMSLNSLRGYSARDKYNRGGYNYEQGKGWRNAKAPIKQETKPNEKPQEPQKKKGFLNRMFGK